MVKMRTTKSAIRMLRPDPQVWGEADISRWLPALVAQDEVSDDDEHAAVASSLPTEVTKCPPETNSKEDATKHVPQQSEQSVKTAYSAKQLLQRCAPMTHDPLSGWVLDKQTLKSLLIQCPIFADGLELKSLRIVGDTNLASAILTRLDPDQTVTITLFDGHVQLIDRLDVLLRSPNSSVGITNELARHTHLLPKKKLRDQDVAEYLGISEAAIRKARNRDRRAR